MKKTNNWLTQFLVTCSGEDNYILKKCKIQIQKRFELIGFLVLIIFVGCFFSATFFTYSLFDGSGKLISIPMGIIWGAIIVNIYLLLLHTISPQIIPLSSKKKNNTKTEITNQNQFLTLSMLLRMGFMVFLAIIIAQPLNVISLSSTVANSIEKHKIVEKVKLYSLTNKDIISSEIEQNKIFTTRIKSTLDSISAVTVIDHIDFINNKIKKDELFLYNSSKALKKIKTLDSKTFLTRNEKLERTLIISSLERLLNDELKTDNDFIEDINSISIDGNLKNDFDTFKFNISLLVNEKINNYNLLNSILERCNFYVKTIQLLLAENPLSWIITFGICLLFLAPIYFKFSVRNISAKIFQKQEKNETEIVKLRGELIHTKDYNWLVKKLKSINIKNIHTSDYYFQRMLIEHKIILEEYEETKIKYSNILTKRNTQYNKNSLDRLKPLLFKLKETKSLKYNDISDSIYKEFKDEIAVKYEYWIDSPFRTIRPESITIKNNEMRFLDFIYNQTDETNNTF